MYEHSSRLVSVLGVSQEVIQGQDLEPSDLRQVDVATPDDVASVPVALAGQVLGKPVAVTLLPGALLSMADIATGPALPSGQAIVGVDVKPGMLPANGVDPGEPVMVVLTAPTGSSLSTEPSGGSNNSQGAGSSAAVEAPSVIGNASVVAVNDAPDDATEGDVVVSLVISANLAPLVADASAAGQAALVQIGGTQ
jgi:hypothetical protein